jgi:hypothetical protein
VRHGTRGTNCPHKGPKFKGDDFEVNDLPDPERVKGQEHVDKAETTRRRVWIGALQHLGDMVKATLPEPQWPVAEDARSSVARLDSDAIGSYRYTFRR